MVKFVGNFVKSVVLLVLETVKFEFETSEKKYSMGYATFGG